MEKFPTADSERIQDLIQDTKLKVSEYLMPSEEKAFEIYCQKRVLPTIEGKTIPKDLKQEAIEELKTILVTDFTASSGSIRKLRDSEPQKSPFLEPEIDTLCANLWNKFRGGNFFKTA